MVKPLSLEILSGGEFSPNIRREKVSFQEKDKNHLDLYHANSITDLTFANGVKDEHWQIYNDPKKVIEKQIEEIHQHIERRVQLFFMQLISCYRVPFHFEWEEANDQYGKGRDVKMISLNRINIFKTEGAHSSTLPCLIAYPKDEWDLYLEGKKVKPKGFVWLKYSHAYTQQNATIELAKFVNKADCLLDGTHTNPQLREAVIPIINDVAEGKYDPTEGLRKFVDYFKEYSEKQAEKLSNEDPRFSILEIYSCHIYNIIKQVNQTDYFDTLLGLNIAGHERENLLRDIVYKKRYRLIQECNAIESKIARIILTAQNTMLGKNSPGLKTLDNCLRYTLLEDSNPFFRRTLQRLLCTSLEQLQASIEKNKESLSNFEKATRIENFRQKHGTTIENLKRDLRVEFRHISNAELQYRSDLFKDLRDRLNHWTQKKFAEMFKIKYPSEPMSQPMVSRLEEKTRFPLKTDYKTALSQRNKDLDIEKGKKIAATFGIDPGLFLPGLITSNY